MGSSKPVLTFVLAFAFVFLFFLSADRGATLDSAAPPPPTGHGRIGVYLTSYALGKEAVLRAVLQARAEGKIDALVINVKNNLGEVTYASDVLLARRIGAATGRVDFHKILPVLRAQGFYLIARQVVFNDPLLTRHLGIAGDWVPADDPTALAYNLAIAEEVAGLGFDELQFDYIRYADGGGLANGYEPRYVAVNRFLALAHDELSGRIALSADLFGRVMWSWNLRRTDPIGQSLEDVCRYVDFVSPMLYPSHYAEQSYKDSPYSVVRDALKAGKERVSTPIRPFLQAFDMAIPAGMSLEAYIREQVRAAVEFGADGYLFWNPSCEYEVLFRVLD